MFVPRPDKVQLIIGQLKHDVDAMHNAARSAPQIGWCAAGQAIAALGADMVTGLSQDSSTIQPPTSLPDDFQPVLLAVAIEQAFGADALNKLDMAMVFNKAHVESVSRFVGKFASAPPQ